MILKNINVSKLHEEFIKTGIKPFPVFELENGDGDFTFTDGTDMDLAQQIIDEHDPTPLPPQPTAEERLQMAEDTILGLMDFILMGGM